MARPTLLALLLLAASPLALAADSSKWPTKRSPDPEWGQARFEQYCWQCHGRQGEGDGPAAANMQVEVPVLRGISNNATRGDLVTKVRQGSGPMPAYHDSVSRQDVRRIFVYLESLDDPKKTPTDDADADEPVSEDDAPADEGNAPDAEGGE